MARNSDARGSVVAATRRRLPVIAFTAALFLAFGAYYYFYVRSKTTYVVSRDMRILSSAALQLDRILNAKSQTVMNFATSDQWPTEYVRRAEEQPLDRFMADLEHVVRDVPKQDPQFAQAPGHFEQRLVSANGRLVLEIEYWAPGHARHATGRISFARILSEVFEPLAAFDSVLLVRGDGSVLYQQRGMQVRRVGGLGRVLRFGRPDSSSTAPSDLVIMNLSSLHERVGWNGHAPLPLERIRDTSRRAEVLLSGSTYILLSQPYPFATPTSRSIAAQRGASYEMIGRDGWMICGVISKARFMSETMEISTSTIAIVTALLLLTLCGGPFLKLALLGDEQPLTRSDVMLTGMALLLGTAIATLIIVDLIAYQQTKTMADDEQRSYSERLEEQFDRTIGSALALSDALRSWSLQEYADGIPAKLPRRGVGGLKKVSSLTNLPAARDYRWFSSFAWIDNNDRHHFRGWMYEGDPPLLDLSTRPYIRATRERPWRWRSKSADGTPIVRQIYVDSGITLTTGRPETVFAVPTDDKNLPVFAVTMPFIAFADPVAPPGLRFAIIDNDGKVLYHSDRSRIGIENVFAETDQNRQLQAATASRASEFIDLRYWGEDHRVLVQPLHEVPWTLLTFRDKRLLRTMNFQALVMTLILLLLYLLLWVLVFLLFGFARPSARASWLWPDEYREAAWKRLRWILWAVVFAAALAMYFYAPGVRLAMSFLAPLDIALTAYIVLRRRCDGVHVALSILWIGLTAALISGIIGSHIDLELVPSQWTGLVRGTVLALTIAAIALALRDSAPASTAAPWKAHARPYVTSGVIALLVLSSLPAVGFFLTSYRLGRESLLRYGQLVYAEELQRRIEELAEGTWDTNAYTAVGKSYLLPEFFESLWCLQPATPNGLMMPCDATSTAARFSFRPDTNARWKIAGDRLAQLVEELVPRYSDDAAAMRDLHGKGAADGSWQWLRSGRAFALVRNVTFNTKTSKKLTPPDSDSIAAKDWSPADPSQLIVISRLPRLLPDWFFPKDAIGPYDKPPVRTANAWQPEHYLWRALAVLLVGGLLLPIRGIVKFVARKVFAYDMNEPSWLTCAPIRPLIGDPLFLIHYTRTPSELIAPKKFKEISFAALEAGSTWDSELAEIESASGPRSILVTDFAWRNEDAGIGKRKLVFLERIVQIPNRSLIVASTMSLGSFLAGANQTARWNALFLSFIELDERRIHPSPPPPPPTPALPPAQELKQLPARAPLWKEIRTKEYWKGEWAQTRTDAVKLLDWMGLYPHPLTNAAWLKEESREHPVLQSLSRELSNVDSAAREQIADDFGEAAEAYYRAIWLPCSAAERLLLYQIARYSYANMNNRKALRRLMARGLVVRSPEIRIFNETFRYFVLCRASEILSAAPAAPESAWDRLRVPLLVGIGSAAAFFIATQQELSTATSAIVAALTTGLPAVVKLVGLFTDRRSATPIAD